MTTLTILQPEELVHTLINASEVCGIKQKTDDFDQLLNYYK